MLTAAVHPARTAAAASARPWKPSSTHRPAAATAAPAGPEQLLDFRLESVDELVVTGGLFRKHLQLLAETTKILFDNGFACDGGVCLALESLRFLFGIYKLCFGVLQPLAAFDAFGSEVLSVFCFVLGGRAVGCSALLDSWRRHRRCQLQLEFLDFILEERDLLRSAPPTPGAGEGIFQPAEIRGSLADLALDDGSHAVALRFDGGEAAAVPLGAGHRLLCFFSPLSRLLLRHLCCLRRLRHNLAACHLNL
mmetsp:Transcript_19651/g.48674  ORF Transcript_19651/g.48674 Transcript_19651/m.48674 type:complete len:251 (+) Transcript_19651:955-1707(+)